MNQPAQSRITQSHVKSVAVSIMAVVILGFCLFGFGSKFVEFVRLVLSDEEGASEGIFAVAPLTNYLLASAGFLCLLGWAAAQGMFRNIEGPKRSLLETESQLDAQSNTEHFCDSVMRRKENTPV